MRYQPVVPRSWQLLGDHALPSNHRPEMAPLFVHSRYKPSGEKRTVWVSVVSSRDSLATQGDRWIVPPTRFHVPELDVDLYVYELHTAWEPFFGKSPHLILYAARADLNDSSSFTMDYELNGKTGVIVGRLKDDDSLELEPSVREAVAEPQGRSRPVSGR